jgi:carboxylesterase type B
MAKGMHSLSVALLVCSGFGVVPLCAADFPHLVRIDTGMVRGVAGVNSAITVFKGIPFAAPPVGELRWKPPVRPGSWHGVMQADHFGPSCMQPVRATAGRFGEISEDCLYLNVWTPATRAAEKLPVMVWIYGGGFQSGSAANPQFDGEGLAAKGVVRVSLNYRLGILGFLAHPELDKESPHGVSGNYGLLDEVAALQWVARNIAAFGGDPNRVTIFGQSAGGASVHFLSLSPMAKGLFQRAISENGLLFSGDPFLQERSPSAYKRLDAAESDNLRYLRQAGVESLQQLRAMNSTQINALPPAPFPPAFFGPLVDGWLLPQGFAESYAHGAQSDAPFMAGWTSVYYPGLKISVAAYHKWIKARFGAMAGEYLALYPAASDEEAGQAVEQAARDSYRTSLFLWARQRHHNNSRTYIYYYNHGLPGSDKEKYGAGAGAEIPYVMNSLAKLDRPFVKADYALADMMSAYWANFAANGDPNGKGLPFWPAVDLADIRTLMQLGDDSGRIPVASEARFEFYRRFFASQPPKCSFAEDCSIDMQ